MNKFWVGLKNKKGLFLAILALSSITAIVPSSNNRQAYAEYKYSVEECKKGGFKYDEDGGGQWGYGCLVQGVKIKNGKVEVDGGLDPIGQPENLVKKKPAYKLNEGGVCFNGYSKKSYNGIDVCELTDKDTKNVGLPSGSSKKNELTEDICKKSGGIWGVGGNNKFRSSRNCFFNNEKGELETYNNLSSLPSRYLTTGECAPGFIKSKNQKITDYTDANAVEWYGKSQKAVYTCAKEGTKAGENLGKCNKEENKDSEECKKNPAGKEDGGANGSKDKNSCDIEWVGWIVCPITRGATGIVVGMYNFMQDNFLNIKSDQLFSNSGKGAEVYRNWSSFRDMANVFFVIMIAIIIFSQVTSAGISNYGIKKMLPKIIIYAILVNISWYLAVIAVDISNIAGSTIFNWLVKDGWYFSNAAKGTESPVESILSGVAGAAGLVVVAGVTAALVGGGTILLFMISAAIALITTLLILMIREAAVVVLVVISPLAFVMGLLPNTEGFLKKWMRFMKNMLIIYPICSLMVGGAIFVSNLLFNITDKPILKVMYGVLPILSLFAIVAIIKTIVSVIDGLTGGNLRGALGKMSGHINAAAQDSNWARASRAKLADRTIGGIAIGKNARNDKFEEGQYERDKAALEKLDKKKNKTAADYRRRARYGARVASYEKSQNEGMVAAMTYSIGNDSSRVNDELDKISEVKDPGQQRLMYGALAQAVTSSGLNSSGQATAMNSIAQSALNISHEGQRKAVAAQIASRAGSDFKKVNPAAAKAVMQDFSNPDSIKSVAQMEGDVSTYSGASAKQMADWATMSSSNINDNKAIKAMYSAFKSGDSARISQARNMGKIAEQALNANAAGALSLTPDQQKNFEAMRGIALLAQRQDASTNNDTADSGDTSKPDSTASDPEHPNRK